MSGAPTDPIGDGLESLVARYLALHEAGDRRACERLLREHPGEEAELRRRLSGLRKLNLLEEAPEWIGPYRVLNLLGEGGMGSVFLAEQREPIRRRVAVKVIKLGMDSKAVLARFEAERQALALLSHSNIAKVLDAGTTDRGQPYFVMEHLRGEPITTFCDRHGLGTRARIELFLDVCRAVQHAHEHGIIHRDLKPANVLVSYEDGRPVAKIIDFGVARAIDQRLTERTLFTEHGQLIGTPEYMSPEQAEMGGLEIDVRSDVYSLGILFYELMTGLLPFDPVELRRAGYAEIQRRIREMDTPRPSTRVETSGANRGVKLASPEVLAKELRGDLDWITLKALQKDRVDRYQSSAAFAADLGAYLAGGVVSAGRPSVWRRARRVLQRNRGRLAVVVPSLLAVSALVLLWQANRAAVSPAMLQVTLHDPQRGVADVLEFVNTGDVPLVLKVVDARGQQVMVVDVAPHSRASAAIGVQLRSETLTAMVPVAAVEDLQLGAICEFDCLAEGTPVHLVDAVTTVERLSPGATLATADGGVVRVLAVHRSRSRALVELGCAGGTVLVTRGHPFLTVDRGWLAADQLSVGDAVLGRNGTPVEIVAARPNRHGAPLVVYSLELERADAAILVGVQPVAAAGSAAAMAAGAGF